MLQCHVFLPGWSTCVSVILYKFLMGASRLVVGATIVMGLVLSLDVKEPGCSFDQSQPCSDMVKNTDHVG